MTSQYLYDFGYFAFMICASIACLVITINIAIDIKKQIKKEVKYYWFKTGKIYTVLHRAFAVTDGEHNPVIVYKDNEYVYVRDERDFYEKFTAL